MPDTYSLDGFTKHGEDLAAAEAGDPNFDSGYQYSWTRQNRDGSWTLIESTWGVRCADWDGGTPLAPYTPSHALGILVCQDPADPGGTEITSDYHYFDGPEADYTTADRAARQQHDDEAASGLLTGLTELGVAAIVSAVNA